MTGNHSLLQGPVAENPVGVLRALDSVLCQLIRRSQHEVALFGWNVKSRVSVVEKVTGNRSLLQGPVAENPLGVLRALDFVLCQMIRRSQHEVFS